MSQSSSAFVVIHKSKIKEVRLNVAKFSFKNKVANEWNILDEKIISDIHCLGLNETRSPS